MPGVKYPRYQPRSLSTRSRIEASAAAVPVPAPVGGAPGIGGTGVSTEARPMSFEHSSNQLLTIRAHPRSISSVGPIEQDLR